MKDLNNFWRYLPGSYHRETHYRTSPHIRQVTKDLDRLLDELQIDGQAVREEIEKYNDMIIKEHRKFESVFKENPDKAEKAEREYLRIGKEIEKKRLEAYKKIFPAYDEMIKLGYTRDELIR